MPPGPSLLAEAPDPPELPADADRPAYDGWELDEQLRHVERLLAGRTKPAPQRQLRVDAAHTSNPPRAPARSPRKPKPAAAPQGTGSSFLWPLLAIGMMAFVCGGVLVGWSLVSGRAELWDFGLPTALLGQLALLTGLILQLERMGSDSRDTASKLEHVDDQLNDLKSAATLLGTSQSTAGSSFYAHLAGGAGPQLLLADLKSQLDLLAVKIGRDDA